MSQSVFYIVQNKITSQKPLTLFATKGLEDSVPAHIHEIPLIPFAKESSPITSLFMSNIGAFVTAYKSQSPAISFNDNRYIDVFRTLPFDPQFLGVPIVKTRAMKGTVEEQEAFFEGCSFTRAQSGQAKIYIGVPSPKFMKEAAPFMLESFTQADRGQTNMLGFFSFIKIAKTIKLVTYLHNEICNDKSGAIGITFFEDVPADRMQMDDDDASITLIDGQKVNSTEEWKTAEGQSKSDLLKSTVSLGDGSMVAIPVAVKPSVTISGPVDDCPFEEGLPIPYFNGSIIGDMYHTANFFQQHLLPLFGEDLKTCIESFQDFRKGCFSLGTTKKGMMMSHMMVVLEMAMKVGKPVYFCIEGEEYCGAVIGGSEFSIFKRNMEYKALSGNDFIHSMSAITGHEGHLRALGKLLSACVLKVPVDGQDKLDVTVDQMRSSRAVYELIKKRKISGTDAGENSIEKEMMAILEKCTFDRSYLTVTAESLLQAFDQIIHPDKEIWDEKTPVYLPACALSSSRSVFILSHFGRYAPSLLSMKGDKVPLPTSEDRSQDPALIPHPTMPEKKLMEYVGYHLKLVSLAAVDAEKVIKKKEVVSEVNMKGLPAKASGRFGGKERDTFWYGLGALLKDHVVAKNRGTKRKAAGVTEEESKKKLARAAELFLESMW